MEIQFNHSANSAGRICCLIKSYLGGCQILNRQEVIINSVNEIFNSFTVSDINSKDLCSNVYGVKCEK